MGLRATRRKARFTSDERRRQGSLLVAIDTSGSHMNLGVQRGPHLLAVHSSYQPFSHARALLPALDLLLGGQGFRLDEVDVFGVCLGPGSFTGLRVGMSTVKSFSLATGKPAVGITAPEALAAATPGAGLAGSLIDARKGEVYSTLFRRSARPEEGASASPEGYPSGSLVEVLSTAVSSPEEAVARLLAGTDEPIQVAGSALVVHREAIAAAGGDRLRLAGPDGEFVDPAVFTRLCMAAFEGGRGCEAGLLEPCYVGEPPIHQR